MSECCHERATGALCSLPCGFPGGGPGFAYQAAWLIERFAGALRSLAHSAYLWWLQSIVLRERAT
jgi:hypothetical protein